MKGVINIQNKIERIKELIKLCNYHSKLYYIKDKPEISDKEYDKLYDELIELEYQTGYILSSSPTQKVQGKVVSYLQKIQHTEPMLSADKTKDINNIISFMDNKECSLSWKLDGLTIVLRYNQGKFTQAITRGRGIEGEDVTHTVSQFTNIPLTIDYKEYLELRGEGLVLLNEFERINNELISNGEESHKSARNLAAGSVRQLDANITKQRNLIFQAFGIVKCNEILPTKYDQFRFLQNLGFETVYHEIVDKTTIKSWIEIFKNMIPNLSFLTDGLIIEYNDIEYGKRQGFTGHHTKNMMALKWQDDCCETIFRGVELNTTRTGMVSITGLFDNVDIDGVNVSRASLHNYDIFESLQLGIGDNITVYRANMVIPQIEENLTRSNTYNLDMICPSCGSKLVIKRPKDARFLFCENDNCPSKLLNRFVHFVSKDGMNIEGLSEATLEKFINKGWLKTFDDIYYLDDYKSEIIKMDGMGIKNYNNLWSAIEKSKSVKMENFLVALGIPQIGKSISKTITKYFNNDWFKFESAYKNNFNFTKLDDFGQIMNDSLYKYLSSGEMGWYNLIDIINFIQEEKKETSLKDLIGQIFVITGSVNTFKNRDEFKELVESLNGKVTGGVTSKTNYLVNNDVSSTSGKNKTAKDLGVKIISEQQFNEMIGRIN